MDYAKPGRRRMANRKKGDGSDGMVTRSTGPRKRTAEQEKQLARMADLKDEEVDTSDIPEITENQWSKSELFRPKKAFTSFRWDAASA